MSPNVKNLTFKQFIDSVQRLVKGRGLTHREVLDIMEFRMGGSFLQDLRDLRADGASLAEVVQYFLTKDADMRKSARRKARLEAQAKVRNKKCKCTDFETFNRYLIGGRLD